MMNLKLVLLLASLLRHQNDPAPQEAKARNLMQAMQAKYSAAKTLIVSITTQVFIEKNGNKRMDRSAKQQVEAQRPASFRMQTASENSAHVRHSEKTLSDGKSLWNYEEQSKQYMQVSAGGMLAQLASSLGTPGDFFMWPDYLDAFLKPNPLVTLRYIGSEKIEGRECETVEVHLAPPAESIPATVQTYYIGTNHLLRRLVSQMVLKDTTYTTVIDIQSTVLDKKLPGSLFVFAPPPGAVRKEVPDMSGPR